MPNTRFKPSNKFNTKNVLELKFYFFSLILPTSDDYVYESEFITLKVSKCSIVSWTHFFIFEETC